MSMIISWKSQCLLMVHCKTFTTCQKCSELLLWSRRELIEQCCTVLPWQITESHQHKHSQECQIILDYDSVTFMPLEIFYFPRACNGIENNLLEYKIKNFECIFWNFHRKIFIFSWNYLEASLHWQLLLSQFKSKSKSPSLNSKGLVLGVSVFCYVTEQPMTTDNRRLTGPGIVWGASLWSLLTTEPNVVSLWCQQYHMIEAESGSHQHCLIR